MSPLVRSTLSLAAAIAAGCAVSAVATPASAATFRCSAFATVNDVGPGADQSFGTPCSASYETTGGFNATQVSASVGAQLGLLKSASAVSTTNSVFASANSYAFAGDSVAVSGLGEDGADLTFLIAVDGILSADASLPTQFAAATAASSFAAAAYFGTSRGLSATARLSGCVRNVQSGISTCNGDFDYGPSTYEVVDNVMMASLHVWNGDILDIGLELRSSALGHTPYAAAFAHTYADFGHTLTWGGIRFNDASRDVILTSTSGFDYRKSAIPASGAPEPAAWALMILGFGAAGTMLRRRQVVVRA